MNAASQTVQRHWFSFALIGLVLLLYAPSIQYGLIWDDPKWYAQGQGQNLWQLFTSLDTYQFYRPIAIWLNRQMVAPTGIIAAQTAHMIQISAQALAVLAVVPLLSVFKFERRHAQLAAVIFALYPLSFQAVAWQAPQQPIAMLAVFMAILLAARFRQRRQARYLIPSLFAYAFALLFQESALPFVVMFFWLAWFNEPVKRLTLQRRDLWPLLHLALAAMFFVIWLNVPRDSGVTGHGFDARVLAYGLQGSVFPFAAALAQQLRGTPATTLIAVYAAIWLLLTIGVRRWQGKRTAAVSALWLLAGLLPIIVGLSWSYTRIGARLLYPASLGIAMLWGGWAAQLFVPIVWRRAIGVITAIGLVWISISQWSAMRALYEQGTRYLDETIAQLSQQPDRSTLLVNYPDRLWLRPEPYPLGEWGLILAPVVQNVSDYAVAKTGHSAATQSLSAFRVGADQRGAYPYEVFTRGEDTSPEKLAEVAAQFDRVALTEYAPDGSLTLREVGSIQPISAATYRVQFANAAQLIEAQIEGTAIKLVWRALSPLREGDTIFVHVMKDGQVVETLDGDSLGGLLPPAKWPLNVEIGDVRSAGQLPPGHYEVWAGLYNRNDGTRYRAADAQGQRLSDDAVIIGNIEVR